MPSIFPNNSVKYDVNKTRARKFASETKRPLSWVQAQDKPCQRVLQGRVKIKEDKQRWLTWHDKDCGDLYGMLPLVKGMPVRIQDHLNINAPYRLLQGKIGKIHSWVMAEGEKSQYVKGVRKLHAVPKVVFVKFDDAEWQLPGTPEKGIYPIRPWNRTWFLDAGRKNKTKSDGRGALPSAAGASLCENGPCVPGPNAERRHS